jgi:hypothetical protein
MRLRYRQAVTQRYPVEVLINIGVQEHYFIQPGNYLFVNQSCDWSDFQVHQQINNERSAIAT